MGRNGDRGYALIAAIGAVAVFAYVALQVLAADQGVVALERGRAEQARLYAAADAGLMLAIHGLATDDQASRWSIDGRPRRIDFAGFDLSITVENERGKAPLVGLDDAQARALFQGAGASGDRLDALVEEFRVWQQQNTAAASAASASAIAAPGYRPRHGPFLTIGELMGMKDMDRALYERIAPAVTVFFEQSGPFEPAYARPLAIAAMRAMAGPGAASSTAAIDDQLAPRPELDTVDDHLIGRTLTVRVTARDRAGGQTHRTAIVELTGGGQRPYWVRYAE